MGPPPVPTYLIQLLPTTEKRHAMGSWEPAESPRVRPPRSCRRARDKPSASSSRQASPKSCQAFPRTLGYHHWRLPPKISFTAWRRSGSPVLACIPLQASHHHPDRPAQLQRDFYLLRDQRLDGPLQGDSTNRRVDTVTLPNPPQYRYDDA